MIVWRVEHAGTGVGPYVQSVAPLKDLGISYDWRFKGDAIRYPHPHTDGIDLDVLTPYHLFGFTSPGQLHNWFADAFPKLKEHGFAVVRYGVDSESVLFGNRQCAFDSRVSERVSN